MICEAGLATSAADAMSQDAALCMNIIVMRQFAALSAREKQDAKSLTATQREFLYALEREASAGEPDEALALFDKIAKR